MGKTYLLNKNDFNYNKVFENQISIKEILTPEEAKDLVNLQAKITSEISEEITLLTESALTKKNPYGAEGLIFCIATVDNKCIGYGYGYIDNKKDIFYLDTIGVDPDYRGKKIGIEIKVKLINHAFENPKIKYIKAITQTDNEKTIHINKKLGFIDVIDNSSK
jgi:RimJ/RimL family protein N-acetyltransferase